jgi:tape measure domain-containing protein
VVSGNTLEFFIKMRDMMSSGLVALARNANTSLGQVQSAIDKTIHKNNELSSSMDKVDRSARSSNASILSYGRNLLATAGVTASVAGAIAFASTSVKAAANYEATKKSFEVLTGNAGTGRNMAAGLNSLQQSTILGPEVFKNAQTMLGFGITANKVIPNMKMLGDVAMGDAERLGALTLAFSQVGAAGKLSGQDLLQFINAGFNPLQEIAAKTGKTIGDLKKEMESGNISFAMVEDAFKSATSTGGKFDGMMDQMAGTTYGRMQILSGAWEKFKIDSGNALIPVAEGMMKVASSTLAWLNISKSAPQVLSAERAEIGGLVSMITSLNQGNLERSNLMGTLIKKYPELFGNIDKERTSNYELLQMLGKVNEAYEKRITLAGTKLSVDTLKGKQADAYQEMIRMQGIVSALQRGDTMGAHSLASGMELFQAKLGGGDMEFFTRKLQGAQFDVDRFQSAGRKAEQAMTTAQIGVIMNQAMNLANDNAARQRFFGKDGKREHDFLAAYNATQSAFSKGGVLGAAAPFQNMLKYFKGTSTTDIVTGPGGAATLSGGAGSKAREVTGSGPRQITINGVKFAENVTITGGTAGEARDKAEDWFNEMFIRLLQSGARVQG